MSNENNSNQNNSSVSVKIDVEYLERHMLNDELHRENGPAFIDIRNGVIKFYKHGKLHNEHGPAVITWKAENPEFGLENGNGSEYWLNGEEFETEEDWGRELESCRARRERESIQKRIEKELVEFVSTLSTEGEEEATDFNRAYDGPAVELPNKKRDESTDISRLYDGPAIELQSVKNVWFTRGKLHRMSLSIKDYSDESLLNELKRREDQTASHGNKPYQHFGHELTEYSNKALLQEFNRRRETLKTK